MPADRMSSVSGVVQVDVLKADARRTTATTDRVAEEVPLEVRLHGEPFSVIMRTPGSDVDLVAGFLFTESVVRAAADIEHIDDRDAPNVVNVTLAPHRAADVPDLIGQRRQVAMNSSCGMCGRRTLESLTIDGPPLASRWTVDAGTIVGLPPVLRDAQRAFAETGGLHAAGVFDTAGALQLSAEDVGRHNAVDKLLGRLLMSGRLPLEDLLLFVSGRSSFEIVQKAYLGGLPLIAAVSAPSSLAIELANRAGITLLGFVRGDRFNVYTHPGRVRVG
jgi:FdhD protein